MAIKKAKKIKKRVRPKKEETKKGKTEKDRPEIKVDGLGSIYTLNGKFVLVNVGSDKNPASPEEIKDIESKFLKLLQDNDVDCLVLVTTHTVGIQIV